MKYFIKEYETRYFAGIEFPNGINLKNNDMKKIPKLWENFFNNYTSKIVNQVEPSHYIGLEFYSFDFKETGTYDYYVLAETKELVEQTGRIVTKKLKPGRYICFPINFDEITTEIQKVYKHIKDKGIKVHMGFDYEDYLTTEDYGVTGAVLNFCLLLEEDA
ncbi:GyrI-like domain-containing protein [Mycoplasmatota bacterium WC30]